MTLWSHSLYHSLYVFRQKRQRLFEQEERLAFALKKKAEYDEIANNLRQQYATEQQRYAQLKKQKP